MFSFYIKKCLLCFNQIQIIQKEELNCNRKTKSSIENEKKRCFKILITMIMLMLTLDF